MQEAAAKSELLNLMNLIPKSETKTVKTFIEFGIEKNNPKKSNKSISIENSFKKFAGYCESRPSEKRLSKKEKKTIQESRLEYKNGETITFNEYKKMRQERQR
jgi:hypothetical protein